MYVYAAGGLDSQRFLSSLVWAITMLSSAVSRGVGAVKVHKRMYATSEAEAKQGTSEEGKVWSPS